MVGTTVKTYLQVTRDVGSGQDASCSGEKYGKHWEERLLTAEVRCKVLQEDFGFEKETKVSEFEDVLVLNLLKCNNFEMMLTVVIEDSFWFLVICGREEGSYKHIHYGYQQDNKENKLGLWRAE